MIRAQSPYEGTNSQMIRPIVKWPGGKTAMIDALLSNLPSTFGDYYEPFVGSAALFLAIRPRKATLSDRNSELINFYKVLRRDPVALYLSIAPLSNDSATYYRFRAYRPRSEFRCAMRFLYLNRTCFGGLYRLNQSGRFNVPFGGNGRSVLPSRSAFMSTAAALKEVKLRCQDFRDVVSRARKNDLVYLDPPYTVTHNNNGFVRYNAILFSWEDQKRLKETVDTLTRSRVRVILTNADHVSLRNLYRGYNIRSFTRASTLSAKAELRRSVNELIITNY